MLIEKSRGFTLIELMIVVAIIGILAMFALPQYAIYIKKTKIIEGVNLFNGLKSNVIENFTATGTMQVRNFSELGYSSSEFYSGDSKKLRMSRPLKYIEMTNRDNINDGVGNINEFTLVFDETIDKKNNELMMVVYPPRYDNAGVNSGTKTGGLAASFTTHCVSYLKTKANVAIQAQFLPKPCKPSNQY